TSHRSGRADRASGRGQAREGFAWRQGYCPRSNLVSRGPLSAMTTRSGVPQRLTEEADGPSCGAIPTGDPWSCEGHRARYIAASPSSQPPYVLAVPDHDTSRRHGNVEAIAAVDQGPLVRVLDAINIQHQKVIVLAALDFRDHEAVALRRKEQIG